MMEAAGTFETRISNRAKFMRMFILSCSAETPASELDPKAGRTREVVPRLSKEPFVSVKLCPSIYKACPEIALVPTVLRDSWHLAFFHMKWRRTECLKMQFPSSWNLDGLCEVLALGTRELSDHADGHCPLTECGVVQVRSFVNFNISFVSCAVF